MNKTLNIIISVVAIVGVVLGYAAYNKTPNVFVGSQGPVGPQGERGPVGPAGRDGVDGITKIVTQVVEVPAKTILGAVSGPDNYSPYWKQNGVQFDYFNQGFLNTGSTTCSFAITATSTLVSFTTHATRLASSTMAEIGTAATRHATTTSLGKATLPTGGGLLTASTTAAFGLQLTPGTFLNMKIGGGDVAGTLTPVGVCKAVTIRLDNLN